MEDAPSEPAPLSAYHVSGYAHHPKPGHGIRLPPESEDLPWLIDDDFLAFSHIYKDVLAASDQVVGPGQDHVQAMDTEMTGGEANHGGGGQQQQHQHQHQQPQQPQEQLVQAAALSQSHSRMRQQPVDGGTISSSAGPGEPDGGAGVAAAAAAAGTGAGRVSVGA